MKAPDLLTTDRALEWLEEQIRHGYEFRIWQGSECRIAMSAMGQERVGGMK